MSITGIMSVHKLKPGVGIQSTAECFWFMSANLIKAANKSQSLQPGSAKPLIQK